VLGIGYWAIIKGASQCKLKSFPSPPAPLPCLGEGRHNSSSPSPFIWEKGLRDEGYQGNGIFGMIIKGVSQCKLKSFPSPPAPLPCLGEGRHNSSSPSPFIWEKGLGDEGYQGNGAFGMIIKGASQCKLKSFPSPPAPLPCLGEGRHNSSSPSPFIWEKGLGDEGYQGNGIFGMIIKGVSQCKLKSFPSPPAPLPCLGQGRHNSSSPSPFIWEKGLGDEGYQGNGTFGMLP
jgi:hypothetical protein